MSKKRKKLIGGLIALTVQIAGYTVLVYNGDLTTAIGVMLMLVGKDMMQDVRRFK